MSRPVLFVDDSPFARAATAQRLGERGLEVTVLASGREAAAIDATAFGAALLDLELDDELGTEVARRLRDAAPELPIAFLTSARPGPALDAAEALGPVFSKTAGVEEAVRWVERVLAVRGARAIEPVT